MSADLRTQLALYGAQIRDAQPILTGDDVTFRGDSSIVVGGRVVPQRRRVRPGLAVAAALLSVLLIGLIPLVSHGDHPDMAQTAPATPAPDLGVFEPVRGLVIYPTQVIYPNQGHLEAVDPNDPSVRSTLDLPVEARFAVPVGWSSDGSLLALVDEDGGHWFVMDRLGELRFRGDTAGCCLFVHSNFLSPDGTPDVAGLPDLNLDQLGEVSGIRDSVWSPDGSRVAFAVEREWGMTLAVVEVESRAVRELVPSSLGYVRHIAWSPDGSQLLVTAADLPCCNDESPPSNPLANPVSSRLYVVNVDGSGLREIASGHYVATAWSPDGTRIAALDYAPGGRRVALMGSDGSGLTILAGVLPSGPFTGIAWHPKP